MDSPLYSLGQTVMEIELKFIKSMFFLLSVFYTLFTRKCRHTQQNYDFKFSHAALCPGAVFLFALLFIRGL